MPSARWKVRGRHTGASVGCDPVKTFEQLYAELADKAVTRPAGSGTVWMAAEYESDDRTAEEISQLLYHLQVLMVAKGLSLESVYRHL